MIDINRIRKSLTDLDVELGPFEKCVICNSITEYRRNVHIDHRNFYVDGAGQLCRKCYENAYHATACRCCERITPMDNDYKWGDTQLCKNCFIYHFGETIEEKRGHDDLGKFL